jgi:hypothetical protein
VDLKLKRLYTSRDENDPATEDDESFLVREPQPRPEAMGPLALVVLLVLAGLLLWLLIGPYIDACQGMPEGTRIQDGDRVLVCKG